MKILAFPILLFYSFFLQPQTSKLNGIYKVIYDKPQQGYQIVFKESTFEKVMPDAVSYKGTISYGKYKVTLRQSKDDDPIEIDNREINKDTISFATKSKSDVSRTISRGKLIKIKL